MPRDRLCYRDSLDFETISCSSCGALFVQIEEEKKCITCQSIGKWEITEREVKDMFTIMDLDGGERFSTKDFESITACVRERNKLSINYGKQFALGIARINLFGALTPLSEQQCIDLMNKENE